MYTYIYIYIYIYVKHNVYRYMNNISICFNIGYSSMSWIYTYNVCIYIYVYDTYMFYTQLILTYNTYIAHTHFYIYICIYHGIILGNHASTNPSRTLKLCFLAEFDIRARWVYDTWSRADNIIVAYMFLTRSFPIPTLQ